eukprot:gb/GECG01015222.1/.p1 GENE.gb/GECG01015222.1/~~gb/GECG01015222.1/.p1  ORF type:complete len:102 (+),score=7.36 gb/GECG01015222.1/:1-306(+)
MFQQVSKHSTISPNMPTSKRSDIVWTGAAVPTKNSNTHKAVHSSVVHSLLGDTVLEPLDIPRDSQRVVGKGEQVAHTGERCWLQERPQECLLALRHSNTLH